MKISLLVLLVLLLLLVGLLQVLLEVPPLLLLLIVYRYAIKSLLALDFFDVYLFFDVVARWPEGLEGGV